MHQFYSLALFVCIGLFLTTGAHAQVIMDEDHLKCYQAIRDENPMKRVPVNLFTSQLNSEERDCTVLISKPLLCAPTAKCVEHAPGAADCDDPLLNGPIPLDFTCYKLKCPKSPERDILLFDQFSSPNGRKVRIKEAKMLCAPARKEVITPPGTIIPPPRPSPSE